MLVHQYLNIFISFLIFPEVAGTLLMTVLNSPSQKCYRHCKEDSDCVLAVYFTLLHFSEPINSKPDEVDLAWWIVGGSIVPGSNS